VLSLSWSPSFCDAAGYRAARQAECGEQPYSFVVHGFWPQYEKGFPEYCQQPSPRLIFREWDRHGTCSGLPARAYFETIRKARAVVKIPPEFLDIKSELTVTPGGVEEALVKANPGLTPAAMAVGCDNKQLREIRICMSRDLAFRECARGRTPLVPARQAGDAAGARQLTMWRALEGNSAPRHRHVR
jgi:ribonuclease T2